MIRNYLLTAWRNLLRNKSFSLINIVGLAISMSVCLLAIQIITEQYRTDRANPLKDRIYRVNTIRDNLGHVTNFASSALALEGELDKITGVEDVATIRDRFGGDADTGNKIVPITGYYASSKFFRIFNIPLENGNITTALAEPYSIVLSRSAADKLYEPGETILGRSIDLGEFGEYTITGIVAEEYNKTHVSSFEVLASINTLPSLEEQGIIRNVTTDFGRYYISYVYLVLKEGVNAETLTPFLQNIVDQHYQPTESRTVALGIQNIKSINPSIKERSNELGFSIPFIALAFIGGLALLIMITATFNYTNLSIAKALNRMKEVGVRKVSGANRLQVFMQFIVESVLVSFIALIVGFLLLQLLVPQFYALDPHISQILELRSDLTVWAWFVGFTIFVGILAGALPSLMLSKLQAISILKGAQGVNLMSGVGMRKTLIVVQFALSLIFITTAVILNKQFEYSLNYDLGFDRENIVNIDLQGNDFQVLATEFERIPGVTQTSGLSYVLGIGRLWSAFARNPEQPDSVATGYMSVSADYLPMMKHELVAGKNFPELMNDSTETYVILNEKAVKELHLGTPDEALGKSLSFDENDLEVLGVVKNFNFERITKPIGAFGFRYLPDNFDVINLSVAGDNIQNTMAALEVTWAKVDKVHEFKYEFYDDQIEATYASFNILNKLIGFVAFLAISISVLGLLGMVLYSTQSRLKEVGIRKVLGANSGSLVWMLSRGYGYLLILAILIAVPISFFVNNLWIQEMASRASIGIWDIGIGVVIMLLLGFLIVAPQTYLVSLRNPSDTLRDE